MLFRSPAVNTAPALNAVAPAEPATASERVQITVPAGEVVESRTANVGLQVAGGALLLGAGALVVRPRQRRTA